MKKILAIITASILVSTAGLAQGGLATDGRLQPSGNFPITKFGEHQTGYWPLSRLSQRDSIPTWQRTYGMEVYVSATDSVYVLKDPTLRDGNWVAYKQSSVDFTTLMKYTDTASMLNPYLLNYKGVKYTDTTLMLQPFARTYNNLSDLSSPSLARSNLGLGSFALKNSIDTTDIASFYTKVRSLFSAGTNISLANGQINNTYTYTLPQATSSTLGGVKVGAYMGLSADGTISLTQSGIIGALTYTPENSANKGAANGYASLDGGGKVPLSQLPSTLLIYKGQWNPSTNTPALSDSTGTSGYVYQASANGTVNLGSGSITFYTGDYVIHNGTMWERSGGTSDVHFVNGKSGTSITLVTDDIGEGTANKYFTNARAQSAISLTTTGNSGAATYTNGLFNIPSYTLTGLGGEPSITAGTTTQFWRGDKSWQTLNTSAVPESGNLYYTDGRARASISVSGSLSYNSTTGVISYTQPTNVSTFTNDVGYITGSYTGFDNRYQPLENQRLSTGNIPTFYQQTLTNGYIYLGGSTAYPQIVFKSTSNPANRILYNDGTNELVWRYDGTSDALLLNSINFNYYALPRSGGTLTGTLNGTSASFSTDVSSQTRFNAGSTGYVAQLIGGSSDNAVLVNVNNDNTKWSIGSNVSFQNVSQNRNLNFNYSNGTSWTNLLNITPAGAATFTSSVTATAFYNSSDGRLKKIISRKGDMVTYRWKDGRDKLIHYGYIAQEVRKTMPNQVLKDDKGYLSVNYTEVHTKKINDLENEVAELKQQINELKKLLKSLQQ
ncbi:MAG: hypothetical protein EO766_13340 [Hydrotalea sp. AMD]|uniref:tail fiber domain-containing protein n=1 Tax=Hydrotalea sp. AMD TaxID=2501297 RepID=UPI001025CBB8|nr:tail fiber domain-containing protein [Hydrotalea sp. AMD]RWZ86785.1 MAG: hypothetical protein EO766_13340 [Hydrotalea sp. AMD]